MRIYLRCRVCFLNVNTEIATKTIFNNNLNLIFSKTTIKQAFIDK